MKLRFAKLEDKEDMLRLIRGLYSRSSPKTLNRWIEGYDKMFGCALIAEINNKVIAYIAGSIYGNKKVYIGDLYVLPKYRNKGIAKKLIKAVEKLNKNKTIKLDVSNKNYKAKRLYNKLGFKIKNKSKSKTRLEK